MTDCLMHGIQSSGSYLRLMMIIAYKIFLGIGPTGYLPILVDCDIRKYAFLYKLQYSGNQVLVRLSNMFAKHEMNMLMLRHNVPAGCSCYKFKHLITDTLL